MTKLGNQNDLRCPVCLHIFNGAALMKRGIKGCPVCKTALQPLLMRHDGYIRVNWQDLRTLAIYARRWSKVFDLRKQGDQDAEIALQNIFTNLEKFRPSDAQTLLPSSDPVADSLKRVELKKGKGMIHLGDNIDPTMRPDENGNIISPFFRRLI